MNLLNSHPDPQPLFDGQMTQCSLEILYLKGLKNQAFLHNLKCDISRKI